ncbi:FadR/GntR family transcriptional regulator [Micromonospora zhanjiangensis]
MALTDEAIAKIRGLIQSGELPPGTRLPPEQQLAAQMGLSRSGVREAVKVLESARVLDVRRGDGTYVTSLAPGCCWRASAWPWSCCATTRCWRSWRYAGCWNRWRPAWRR